MRLFFNRCQTRQKACSFASRMGKADGPAVDQQHNSPVER
jgi:hypothetical protein